MADNSFWLLLPLATQPCMPLLKHEPSIQEHMQPSSCDFVTSGIFLLYAYARTKSALAILLQHY